MCGQRIAEQAKRPNVALGQQLGFFILLAHGCGGSSILFLLIFPSGNLGGSQSICS